MLKATWNSLSLRASLMVSMILIILPLIISTLFGYYILNGTIIADYQDVASRQRNQMVPLQDLQLSILQAEIPLEEYLVTGAAERLRDYRSLRQDIETGFAEISSELQGEGELPGLLERARADWNALDAVVTDILAAHASGDETALAGSLSRFDSLNSAANDKLDAIYNLVETIMDDEYLDASLSVERSEWIAGISAGISFLLMAAGIYFFGHTILDSVERLVDGARRFSEGDRTHRIEVHVPPELHKVAEEFNRMINVIHKSEEALADLARRDKLTGLLNRTSYDEVMLDAFERLHRNNEQMALLALDIDYFKRVNDSYGHDAGDEVLRTVARVMLESVRSIDKVFRTGGEEFCILLPGANGTAAQAMAERLRQAVEERTILTATQYLHVTISVGVALARAASDTPAALKKKADIALYQAKAAGRNKVIAAADSE